MKLSIIIVSWKVKAKLAANLRAIFGENCGLDLEVFVVDNNSGDGTVEMVKNNFPQVNLIANLENLGFAKANNQALQRATGDYILLLNPDMQVKPDTLAQLMAWAQNNPQAWITGCKLVDGQGEIIKQVRQFPALGDQLAIALKLPHLFPKILDKYLLKNFDYNKASRVDSIRGSFFLITKKCLAEVGWLDERFFVWLEEVDYCRRVYAKGGEVWYTPVAEAIDYVGQSFSQVANFKKQQIFKASQIKYWQKWHPGIGVLALKLAWAISLPLTRLFMALGLKNRSQT